MPFTYRVASVPRIRGKDRWRVLKEEDGVPVPDRRLFLSRRSAIQIATTGLTHHDPRFMRAQADFHRLTNEIAEEHRARLEAETEPE